MHAQRHDRKVKFVVCRLWTKPQKCRFSRFFVALDRFQQTAVCCKRRRGVKTTLHTSIFAVCLQGSLVQNKFDILTTSELISRHTERQAQQHVEWFESCGNSWVHEPMIGGRCWLNHSWVCLFCSAFSLLGSASFDCFSLFRCLNTALVQFRIHPIFMCMSHGSCAFLSVASDLSIHFFFLFVSLIILFFFLPDNFNFHDVVDNYLAHFRWGFWRPGRERASQKLRVDEVSVQKLKENHETIQKFTFFIATNAQKNSVNDSGEFQEVESNYIGRLSCVSSQLTIIPSYRSRLGFDKRLLLDTWNTSGFQENVFGNQISTIDSPRDHLQGIHSCATPREWGSVLQVTGTENLFTRDDKQNRGIIPMPTFAGMPSIVSSSI